MAFIAAASFAACNLAARSSGCDALSFSISNHHHPSHMDYCSSSLPPPYRCERRRRAAATRRCPRGCLPTRDSRSSRFFSTLDTTPRRSRARPTARTSARSRFFPRAVTSPPTAGAFMCDSIWARHRAKAFAPSAEYTKSEPHTKSHWRSRSPSTLNPSTSFQSNALAFSPDDEVPSVDVLWPRDRLRRRRSNAPPSFVSVAVHD